MIFHLMSTSRPRPLTLSFDSGDIDFSAGAGGAAAVSAILLSVPSRREPLKIKLEHYLATSNVQLTVDEVKCDNLSLHAEKNFRGV